MSDENIKEDGPILTIGGAKVYLDSVNDEGKKQILALQEADRAVNTVELLAQAVKNLPSILELARVGFEVMTVNTKDRLIADGAIAVAEPVEDEPSQETH
tara:strand:- start:1836 stop:2135 length:300 start_codon:yes stop_codon:yes gene_type:complete